MPRVQSSAVSFTATSTATECVCLVLSFYATPGISGNIRCWRISAL